MNKKPVDPEVCANLYPFALESARRVALTFGYAVAVHGSQTRDLDLIAVPWVEDAKPPEAMIQAIADAVDGYYKPRATDKPHGRRAWSIYMGHGGAYIDLSVMPLKEKI